MQVIRTEISGMRAEWTSRRETPARLIKWIGAILPILAATIAAIAWAYKHLQVIP
jgi:hypothetical protein